MASYSRLKRSFTDSSMCPFDISKRKPLAPLNKKMKGGFGFIAEVVDPKTRNSLDPGRERELVLTTLTKEALPLIRYRAGDVASLDFGPCECGRTLARMSRIHSRTDDMVIIQGISVFPSQIEAVLADIEGTKPHFRMVIDRVGANDDVEIQVEVSESVFTDTVSDLVEVEDRVAGRIRQSGHLS